MGCRTLNHAKNERDAWNYYNGSGRRRAIRRKKLRKKFEPFESHKHEVFPLLAHVGRLFAEGRPLSARFVHRMDTVHPDALQLLRKYGVFYKPHAWKAPCSANPRERQCFRNATFQTFVMDWYFRKRKNHPDKEKTYSYVEGVAWGPLVPPMLHAWNAWGIGGKEAVDWTFFSINHRTLYFGIPFTFKEHQHLCRTLGVRPKTRLGMGFSVTALFHRDMFCPRLKAEMLKILSARKRSGKKIRLKSRKKRGSFYFERLPSFVHS